MLVSMIPTMLPIKEVAKQTGLSYEYIRTLCIQNKIIFVRTGTKYLINMERFIDFLNGEQVKEGVKDA